MTSAGNGKVRLTTGNWLVILGIFTGQLAAGLGWAINESIQRAALTERQVAIMTRLDRLERNTGLGDLDVRIRNIEATAATDADLQRLEARFDRQFDQVRESLRRIEGAVIRSD